MLVARILPLAVLLSAVLVPPPATEKKPHETKIHGETLVDNYFWLRDKKNPEVIAHLEAENAYTDAAMKGTEALQQKIYDEQISHIKQSELNLPRRRGDYYYYSRTEAGKQYPIYARKKGSMDAPEEIILDLNVLAKGLAYIDIGEFAVSDDANLLAYSTDTTGNSQYTLFIKDLRTGELLPDKIERASWIVWAGDSKTIFYVQEDEVTQRGNRFFRHAIGSSAHDLLFTETDPLYGLSVSRTRDKAFILLQSRSKRTTGPRYIPANEPTAALRVIFPRKSGQYYVVDHRGDRFYVRTNDRAVNFRLVTVDDSNPSMEHATELIPVRSDVELYEVNVFANHMAV